MFEVAVRKDRGSHSTHTNSASATAHRAVGFKGSTSSNRNNFRWKETTSAEYGDLKVGSTPLDEDDVEGRMAAR